MDRPRPGVYAGSYRCGDIEIDAVQRRLLIAGAQAKVGGRAFDVLLALVERRDRIVSKRELMDLVWPKLSVEENNLLVHMVALRKLLGPRAIATIPGRGYRFTMTVDVVGAPETARDAGAWPPARGNLPASRGLLGRAQDLDAVDALLREHAVVSIVGAAGIGKTRLALAAAAGARLDPPDGTWWVELAPITEGAQVPSTIAGALGIQLPSGRPPDAALATALAGQRMLLVLDNCEHVAEDVALLIDLLRARTPAVRLLVTSQESLKCRDEQVYRLGALAVPTGAQLEEAGRFGAVALFVERAHAADSRFRLADDNVEMVVDVCRRLEGIPLAIELAAARVRLLGVHGLHARLHHVFDVLTGGARTTLRRHQTLRAALEWSHGLLSADERTVFRRIGVFAGGFTLQLAQQVVRDERLDEWLVLDLVDHLIDKSLLIADDAAEPRYRLLETTRAFAHEQLAAAGESEAMLRRHAQTMLELMAATDANCWDLSPAERTAAVQELGNLRAAVDWAMAAVKDSALAHELLGKCWLVWMHNGVAGEGVRRMLRLWPPARHLPAAVEADFCLALARLNEAAGREEHWQAARRAESLYRQLADANRLGDALLLVGTIGLTQGHLLEARQALREARQLVDENTPLRKQAALAATEGESHLYDDASEPAIAAFRRQAALYARAGAAFGEYLALGNVGTAQLQNGDLDAAIESLRNAVDGLRRIDAPYGREYRLGMLSVALALRGDDVDTIGLAREAFHLLRSTGATSSPVLAAALHHARRDDLRRAVLLAGYAVKTMAPRGKQPLPLCVRVAQRVRELAFARRPTVDVDAWLSEGEGLPDDRAAAIAFEEAPLDEPGRRACP